MQLIQSLLLFIANMIFSAIRGIFYALGAIVIFLLFVFAIPLYISMHYGTHAAVYYGLAMFAVFGIVGLSCNLSAAIVEAKALLYLAEKYDKANRYCLFVS